MRPFPKENPSVTMTQGDDSGWTLRDWFAGQALPAVIKHYAEANGGIGADHIMSNCPIIAYRIADAMLKRRDVK